MNLKQLAAKRLELTAKMSELASNKRDGVAMAEADKKLFDTTAKEVRAIDEDIARLTELRELTVATQQTIETRPGAKAEELRGFIDGSEMRSQSVAANGAFIVGEDVQNRLTVAMKSFNGMLESASAITTSNGNVISYPTLDDTMNEAVITNELDARRDGPDLDFSSIDISAYVYDSGIIKISNELVQDSAIDIEGVVITALGQRVARKLQADMTNGSGTNEPSGILTQAVLGVTAAATSSILADELIDLQYEVEEAYAANGKYMMNSKTLLQVAKLKTSDGDYLVTNPITGVSKMLFGKAIVINNNMPDVAAGATPIVFGDLSQYIVRNIKGLQIFKFNEMYQETNEIGFKASARYDGTLLVPSAVKSLVMKAA